ncbi:hypothetical protein VNI00_016398 [Paramarasmius palmivorus]|uniref:Uncharacterized protein n=1 Tax=Paramarasmius palmivorus TaxID=297713 RepID=A0AAW0BCU2_9AGAR
MLLHSLFLLLASFPHKGRTQILHSNSLWETQVNNTNQDRIHAADAAIQQVAYWLDSDGLVLSDIDAMPNFYEVLANYNIETKQQFLNESFIHYIDRIMSRPSGVDPRIRNNIQMGYSLVRAYLAFTGVDHLLDFAKSLWDDVNQFTISDSDISIGNISTKNVTIPQQCENGVIPKGATFQNFRRDNFVLSIDDTAFFFMFSAMLASLEDPPNNTYVSVARNSLSFLMQPSLGPLFPSVIEVTTCQNIVIVQTIRGTSTIGYLIEGLSLLGSLPSGVETDLESMLPKLIMRVFNETANGWPNPAGILPGMADCDGGCTQGPMPSTIKVDTISRDVALARGMSAAYKHARFLSSDLRDAIKAFLGVQVSVPLQNTLLLLIWSKYNAVRKRALSGDDIYEGSWTESHPSSSFDLMNQSSAIQILVDGIWLFEDDHNDTPNATFHKSQSFPVPALAGSIVGGVLFVAMSVVAIILILRWRNRQRSLSETTSHISSDPLQFDPQYVVVPFQWEPQTKLPLDITRSKARTQTIPEAPVTPSAPIMDDAPQTEKQPHEVPPPPDVRPIDDEHNTSNNSNIVPIADHATSEVPVIHGPSFPDMIRMMYQQMWQPDNTESPPDYRSQS